MHLKARHTGLEPEGPLACVWTLRDRKLIHIHVYIHVYRDPAEVLEATGLSE